MHLPPKGKIEWNLNTIITLIGFGAGLAAWGTTWGSFTADVRAMDQKFTAWATAHEGGHKDSLAAQKENDGRVDARLGNVENEARKIDNLAYRITVVEQSQATTSQALKELKDAVNGQAADIKVMREILEQMRETQGLQRRLPAKG
ncbi:hypothetical protein [Aminobacter sp. BE322]|uniref:hypothetical protein n=1 Tax=unclassified Aminobacter TaxID=2644704 RepID=UPI003D234C9E